MWAALLFNKTTAWILVALSLAAGGFGLGWNARGTQVKAAKVELELCKVERVKDATEAARVQAETEARAIESVAVAEADARAARAKVVYVTKEVIKYVEVTSPLLPDAVPFGVLCAHDASASGDSSRLTAPPCLTPGIPSTFTDADLTAVIVANYGICHENEVKLLAWQKWYADLREQWNNK